jgi:hypothetical protein
MAGCSYAPHALVQGTTSLTFFDEAVRGAFETMAADCPSPPSVLPLTDPGLAAGPPPSQLAGHDALMTRLQAGHRR